MKAIVDAVVGAEVGDALIKPFFDGTLPPGSINFLDPVNAPALTNLKNGLVTFFGAALGCNEANFPKYTGRDMAAVHANIPIGRPEFDKFNDIFIATLASIGVDAGDQATIRSVLDSFAGVIVNPKLICPKYANALQLSQIDLMNAIVDAVVTAEVTNSSIAPFFNGQKPPGSPNILGDTNEVARVKAGLVAFFGGVLGCTEAGFPRYTGPDMASIHQKMLISRLEFDIFNELFINTLAGLNVAPGDLVTVRGILDSTSLQIVSPATICPKYATALNLKQIDLMGAIVGAVVQKEVADPEIKPFFDGTSPPGSINILADPNEVNRVAGGLVAFFGGALGCTEAGFPKYQGADMRTVHAKMPISLSTQLKFNSLFDTTLGELQVDDRDRQTVREVLATFNSQIVNPSYICPKYATALGITQIALMNAIVSAVVTAEVSDPQLKPFFDGTKPPGSLNILADPNQVNRVASGLVAFFGAALGCTEPGFPAYTGPDMKSLHQPMGITLAQFVKFNDIFIEVLAGLQVSMEDQQLIRSVLDSFQSDIVGTGNATPPPSGGGGDADLVAAGYTFNQALDCGITVYWKPVDTTPTPDMQVVEMAVRAAGTGFVAVGFPANGEFKMIGSDAIIGWIDDSSVTTIQAYHLEGKVPAQVVPNTMLTITNGMVTEVDGITTSYFTRVLQGGFNPIKDLKAVTIIGSHHDDADFLVQHTCRVSTAYVINLEDGSGNLGPAGTYTLKDVHGSLMIIGWGAFLFIGVLVARYGRKALKDGLWFTVHQGLQVFGMLMTTTGFIIAFNMVDGVHFATKFHGQLGVAVMSLAYLQMLGGFLRPHKEEGTEPTGPRKVFEIAHPWTGRLLVVLASITIFAGINQNSPPQWHWWVNILFGCVLGFYGVVVIAGEVTGQAKRDNDYSSMKP